MPGSSSASTPATGPSAPRPRRSTSSTTSTATRPAEAAGPMPVEAPGQRPRATGTVDPGHRARASRCCAPTWPSCPGWLATEARTQGFEACWVIPVAGVVVGRGRGRDHRLAHTVPAVRRPVSAWCCNAAARLVDLALERRRSHDLLVHAARHDPLTGLPNRSQFDLRLAARAAARRQPAGAAVPRPRRLQADQRPLRPPGRRPGADHGGPTHRRGAATRRPHRPPRR